MGLNLRFFLFVLGRSKAHGRGGNSCIKSHGRRVDREPRLVKVFYYQRLVDSVTLPEGLTRLQGVFANMVINRKLNTPAMKDAIGFIKPGVREWEIQARWMASALTLGAEGTGYPVWVTSGPGTYQSLCKSTDRQVQKGDMVQLSLGAKYSGYCGNMCRAVVLGGIPQKHMDMLSAAYDCLEETLSLMKPGVPFALVYDRFQQSLDKRGLKGQTLYGPAHSTGLQECEEPWVDNRSDRVFEPDMVFNVDVWIADHRYGVRLEDCVLITRDGNEQLTTWRRRPIILDV